uniref:Small ribosomal subunit protein mS35 mitochondrial conserved domain-containing protein n=1 Tax=Ciona savignyi TaxID=51511 RepID=H2ZED5_CIOSA
MPIIQKICFKPVLTGRIQKVCYSAVAKAGLLPKPFLEDSDSIQFLERMNRHPSFLADMLEQEWSDVWPMHRQFNPYLVPLPLRMGVTQKYCAPPDKFGNLELMKVQNFLHLTPPAVKKHCAALKKFCTPFPEELRSQQDFEREFPLQSHTVDYVVAGKTPRNPDARVVTKTIRLCNLPLDHHARLKLTRLAGEERFNRDTDILTLKVDRCPVRKQNNDFANYLLTALYFESWKTESWEKGGKTGYSDGYLWWEDSPSFQNVKNLSISWESPQVDTYREAVADLKSEPGKPGKMTEERNTAINNYKSSVLKLLNLPALE